MAFLEIVGLQKRFGRAEVLKGIDLTLDKGGFLVLVGPSPCFLNHPPHYHGGFERRVTFNVPVDADAIDATYSNGVLTLRVPKAEAIKPKQIKVQVK